MNKFCLVINFILLTGTSITAQNTRPNIVFILTDDENTNTVGCYEGFVHTPNIDKLAEDGVKFMNANVVSSVCSPSRYNMLTGRYYNSSYAKEFLDAYPLGEPTCINNSVTLEDDNMNVAGILQSNGYTTGFVGKFHLTDHDLVRTNRDWEYNGLKTYPKDSDPRTNIKTNEKLKFNHNVWRNKIARYGFDYVNGVYAANLRELFNQHLNSHNLEWTIDAAVDFIDQQANSPKPFFLVLATTYPHGPAPERNIKGKYPHSLDSDMNLTGEGYVEENFDVMPSRESVKDRFKKLKKDNPDLPENAVTAIWWDDAVGAVVQALKDKGLDENTLIIYTSDHGKINSGKTTLYENGVHVPLIMNWKKLKKPGSDYNHVVGSIDLTPTILDVCRAKVPKKMKMDGLSLKQILMGDRSPIREGLLLEMGYARGIKTNRFKYIAVRYPAEIEDKIEKGLKFTDENGEEVLSQPYLMLHKRLAGKAAKQNPNYFVRDQIYDIQNDLHEQKNIYGEDQELDQELRRLMAEELKKFPHRPFGEFNDIN